MNLSYQENVVRWVFKITSSKHTLDKKKKVDKNQGKYIFTTK